MVMLKKYAVTFFCLLIHANIYAQLEVDLWNLEKTLMTLAKMLGVPEIIPPHKEEPSEPVLPARTVLEKSDNITQLLVPTIENAQALSGYISVYYGFSELSRTLKNKMLPISFDAFMQPAVRSIKKRRIHVACRNYIADILTNPPYLVAENNLPTRKLGFGLTPERVRNIYHSLLSDLATVQAEEYVNNKYKKGKTVDEDSLVGSPLILTGSTLISDLKKIVDRRREFYIDELVKQGVGRTQAPAALSALIDQIDTLKDYTHIDISTRIEVTPANVLKELHKQRSFGLEEGTTGEAMPTGRWLQEGDLSHLIRDRSVLGPVGLGDVPVSDMTTIFDDLSLLNVSLEEILAQRDEIQAKYLINQQILERVVREEKNKLHVFIINAGFVYGGVNRPDQFRWMMVTRYPDNSYIIADAQNVNRINDANTRIIKDAFK